MSGDDIVDELQFRVTVTRLGGQHTAREVMSDIMTMENARAEIVRLRKRLQACQSNDDYPLTDDCITQNERFLLAEVERLRAERTSLLSAGLTFQTEAERLRAAGDALVAAIRNHDLTEAHLRAWLEARRG